MNDWYLIQFKPNRHCLADRNLRRQGFETFLPMQKVTQRKASRFVSYMKPLFPGYMFVYVDSELVPWRKINSTIGVSRLVAFGLVPKPLPVKLVRGLIHRWNSLDKRRSEGCPNKGDSVEMLTGPFANFIATVDTIDPKQRIWVLMDFMGQKTRLEVTANQLQLRR